MNPLERAARGVDGFQQRHGPIGLVIGVVRKYGDDKGGSLAALIAYYGFLSLFPLLLILTTVFGIVAGQNSSIEKKVVDSAVSQFPIIGQQLTSNIHALSRNSPVALTFGLLALLWGALGVAQTGQRVMAEVWNVPQVDRPNFVSRVVRGLTLFVLLGIFVLASSVLAGGSTFGTGSSVLFRILAGLMSLALNVAVFMTAFRILTPEEIPVSRLWPGAIVGGVGYSILQALGGYLIGHQLRHMNEIYGFFALVLGAIWWIYLGAMLTVYAAELNVVLFRRLWPRSLVQPPLTDADRRVLEALVLQEERRPEQEVTVRFKRRSRRPRDKPEPVLQDPTQNDPTPNDPVQKDPVQKDP